MGGSTLAHKRARTLNKQYPAYTITPLWIIFQMVAHVAMHLTYYTRSLLTIYANFCSVCCCREVDGTAQFLTIITCNLNPYNTLEALKSYAI